MLTISPGLLVWTLITFALALFILWRYVFGPVQRIIDERRERVQESLDTADATRQEAAKLLEEYKETLARVRAEADEILERSRRAGEATRAEVVGDARKEAERLVGKAHEQIERDTQAALQTLRDEVAGITLLAAQKVAGRSLTEKDHQRLIEEALREAHLDELEMGARG
jgi:F-type H+-transporting ATPase subunit b